MLEIVISGDTTLGLQHLVLHYNGTLACEADVPCDLTVLPAEDQAAGKLRYVAQLDPSQVVYIDNWRNDRLALEVAALAIVVIQAEGDGRGGTLGPRYGRPGVGDAGGDRGYGACHPARIRLSDFQCRLWAILVLGKCPDGIFFMTPHCWLSSDFL